MNDKNSQAPVQPGRQYWQSLNELAETPAVKAAIENEFPTYQPGTMLSSQSRRHFLKLAGASMALAGVTLTGCRRWPKENLVEQTSRPIGRTPGVPEHYASAFEIGGYAQSLLVTTYDGRPIKIEGNPLHPQCKTFGGKLGSSSMLAQASLLEMYDPERSRSIAFKKDANTPRVAASWQTFSEFVAEHFPKADGSKIAILTEPTSSPTFAAQLAAFTAKYKGAKVYEYEPVSRDNELAASKLAFGGAYRQVYNLAAADVIVSFDADLMGQHPYSARHSNDWASRRRQIDADKTMNRMYVVESRLTPTGAGADERLPARVSLIEELVLQLAHKAGLESGRKLLKPEIEFIDALWADISTRTGKVIIAGGYHLRPEILGVIAAINDKLGAFGSTITLYNVPDRPTHAQSIKSLIEAMNNKQVETLIILGGNPVYDAPTDLNFIAGLAAVPTSIHLSLYDNETSNQCKWHVNRAHYLESWGDALSYDGNVCIQQPMIEPLFGGKTPAELLAILAGDAKATSQSVFYAAWGARLKDPNVANSKALRKALHDGFVAGEQPITKLAVTKPNVAIEAASDDKDTYELRFAADYKMYDGRFANNGWLMEIPDPISKVSWDNVAYISFADSVELGLEQRDHTIDLIEIKIGDKTLKIPGYVLPGQPQGVITLPLGWYRKIAGSAVMTSRPGSIGCEVGYDTYSLRTSSTMYVAQGAVVTKAGGTATIATTQAHHIIEPVGYDVRTTRIGEKSQPGMVVHESTLKAFVDNPGAPHSKSHKLLPLQLFPEPYKPGPVREGGPDAFNHPHAWGMAIDMNTCLGCNACVMACVAENNIPVVGRDQVIMNREMHWLRIDRYFKGTIDDPNPQVTFQPMMCVHCENAPCEEVCPVAATVHDTEGLNTMVYNRCIGTRYCSNNCPYKVRRFNYLDYHSRIPGEFPTPWLGIPDTEQQNRVDKIKALVFNPDVTVRMRGVMEKCTWCTQRIKQATIDRRNEFLQGKREKETVDDFDVVTACQQACATESIVFGDLNDPNSLVSKLQKNNRAYSVLEELNNRPRTRHMAKIRNPLSEPVAKAGDEHH